MPSSCPISVTGPTEGQLVLRPAKDKLTGTFAISLTNNTGSGTAVVYRIRVKESSILFSKTYGMLEPGTGATDTISIYTDKSVAQSGRLSTIRIEYLPATAADTETVRATGADKASCRPFFQRSGVRAYDVHCSVGASAGGSLLKSVVVVSVAAAAVIGVVALLKRRGAATAKVTN